MQGRGRRLDSSTSPSISNLELLTPSRRAPVSEHEYTSSCDDTQTESNDNNLLALPDTRPRITRHGVELIQDPNYQVAILINPSDTEVTSNTEVASNITSYWSMGLALTILAAIIVFIITKIFNWYFNYLTDKEKREIIGKISKFILWDFLFGLILCGFIYPVRNKFLLKGNIRYRKAALELEDLKRKLAGYLNKLLSSNIPHEGDYLQRLIEWENLKENKELLENIQKCMHDINVAILNVKLSFLFMNLLLGRNYLRARLRNYHKKGFVSLDKMIIGIDSKFKEVFTNLPLFSSEGLDQIIDYRDLGDADSVYDISNFINKKSKEYLTQFID
jgi:hypothetical protein